MSLTQTERSDPFLFDAERLSALASPAIVRRGIAYFKENRVSDLGWDGERLWANVDSSRPGGYQVEFSLDEEGELAVDCDCAFDWEPACKHAVAALLSYGAHQPVTEAQSEGAASAAVEARVRRGRSEVEVKHVAGDRWLGAWEARSLDSAADGRTPYQVQIRSVEERINHCTCPDFATNRLGTCKHIEAVRHRLRKRAPRKFELYARQGPPVSVAYLEWGSRRGGTRARPCTWPPPPCCTPPRPPPDCTRRRLRRQPRSGSMRSWYHGESCRRSRRHGSAAPWPWQAPPRPGGAGGGGARRRPGAAARAAPRDLSRGQMHRPLERAPAPCWRANRHHEAER